MTSAQAPPKASRRPDAVQTERPPGRASSRVSVRVLVVDEPGIMRDGLCALLAAIPQVEIVGSASIGTEAVRVAASLRAEIIVLELPQGPRNGPALIATFKELMPAVRIIVLTFHREEAIVEAALRAGADGYVLKSDGRDDLLGAVAGKIFISPAVRRRVSPAEPGASGSQRSDAAPELTERERQVIRLIAAGRRTLEIARLLSLSHKTIEKHRASLMRKLGLRNATAVTAYAILNGIVDD